MRIPRKRISEAFYFIEKMEAIKWLHIRDVVKDINPDNFNLYTMVDFKRVEGDPLVQLAIIKLSKDIIYTHQSKSFSQYLITKDGDVYRLSNHWGAVSTCRWTIDGRGCLKPGVFESGDWELGVANLKDFSIFRYNGERRIDFHMNPQWVESVKTLIPLKDELQNIIHSEDFKGFSLPRKRFIGKSFGKLNGILKETLKM